jgi:iron complex transport system substrate-binding protein
MNTNYLGMSNRRHDKRRHLGPLALTLAAITALAVLAVLATATNTTRADAATKKKKKVAAAAFPVTLKSASRTITLKKKPIRIVSLSPTATEMLFAIGAGPQVKAADEFSNFPAGAPTTKLSGFTPNVEAIAAYKPDLVVIMSESDATKALSALKIPVLVQPSAATLADTYAQIEQLGAATGNIANAVKVSSTMQAEIKKLVAGVPKRDKPLRYYHELDNTLYSVTSKTFVGELYTLLGMVNIADPADKDGSGYPQISAEYLLKSNPDVILLADTKCCAETAKTFGARPGFSELSAVKNGQIIELDDDVASRWGPRVVDQLKLLATRTASFTGTPVPAGV